MGVWSLVFVFVGVWRVCPRLCVLYDHCTGFRRVAVEGQRVRLLVRAAEAPTTQPQHAARQKARKKRAR